MLLPLLVSISVTSNLAVFWRFLTHRDVILFQLLLLHMYQNIPVINGYPKGKTDISRHRLLIRSTWMHPCVVGVLVAHMCFSFSLFVSSRSLCYFCSTVWLHYLIYDFSFILSRSNKDINHSEDFDKKFKREYLGSIKGLQSLTLICFCLY